MKTPATTKVMTSAPQQREFTVPGRLPLKQNTVTAECLSRLLNGERLTSLDGVYEASTTRLGAVIHHLQGAHGWPIDSTPMAAPCADGRVSRVAEYSLPQSVIAQATAAGARAWCESVRKARLERRKKAAEAIREAARINEARRNRRQHERQLSIAFEGPTA